MNIHVQSSLDIRIYAALLRYYKQRAKKQRNSSYVLRSFVESLYAELKLAGSIEEFSSEREAFNWLDEHDYPTGKGFNIGELDRAVQRLEGFGDVAENDLLKTLLSVKGEQNDETERS